MITNDLIGKPFRTGARGPAEYDCLGLTLEGLRRLGIVYERDWDVPDGDRDRFAQAFAEFSHDEDWREIAERYVRSGDVVMLGHSQTRLSHVAMMVPGGVLHTAKQLGACIQSLRSIRLLYTHRRWYRYRG